MNLRVTFFGKVKMLSIVAGAKASLNRANKSEEVDAKPSDLPMVRVKCR